VVTNCRIHPVSLYHISILAFDSSNCSVQINQKSQEIRSIQVHCRHSADILKHFNGKCRYCSLRYICVLHKLRREIRCIALTAGFYDWKDQGWSWTCADGASTPPDTMLPDVQAVLLPMLFFLISACKGAITSKINRVIKLKTSPASLAQLLQPSLAFCFSLQPMTAHRQVRRHWLRTKTKC